VIFVTGATGRVGSKLVESLLRSGERVRVLVRNPQKATILQALGASVFLGDLNQSDRLEEALWGCDHLFSIPPNTLNQAQQEIHLFQAANGLTYAVLSNYPRLNLIPNLLVNSSNNMRLQSNT
jgi:uncharacterized protein YbjT (DUF2867 family)